MSNITNDRLNPVWRRMLYSCIPVATVGIRGLTCTIVRYKLLGCEWCWVSCRCGCG